MDNNGGNKLESAGNTRPIKKYDRTTGRRMKNREDKSLLYKRGFDNTLREGGPGGNNLIPR